MSGWSIDEIENIVWDRFAQSEDDTAQPSSNGEEDHWGVDGQQWENLYSGNFTLPSEEGQRVQGSCDNASEGNAACITNSTGDGELSSLALDMWNVLDDADFSKTAYNPICFDTAMGIDNRNQFKTEGCGKDAKLESGNHGLIPGNYGGDTTLDAKSVHLDSACHFMESKHRDYTNNNVLDCTLEGIADFEEVDKLFQNSQSNGNQAPGSSIEESSWENLAVLSDTNRIRETEFIQDKESRTCMQASEGSDIKEAVMPESPSPYINQAHKSRARNASGITPMVRSNNHAPSPTDNSKKESGFFSRGKVDHRPKPESLGFLNKKAQIKSTESQVSLNSMDLFDYSQDNQSIHPDFQHPKLTSQQGIHCSSDSLLQAQSRGNKIFPSNMQSTTSHFSAASSDPVNQMVIMPPLSKSVPRAQQAFQSFGTNQMSTDSFSRHQLLKRPFKMLSHNPHTMAEEGVKKLKWQHETHKMGLLGSKGLSTSMGTSLAPEDVQAISQWDEKLKLQKYSDGIPQSFSTETQNSGNICMNYGSHSGMENGIKEATILQEFQSSVSQLDIRTRLCIRDALYRLARSAMQRQSVSESDINNSTEGNQRSKGHMEACKCDCHSHSDSYNGNTDFEKETNAIDRTVAHLLFSKTAMTSSEEVLNTKEVQSQSTPAIPQLPQKLEESSWHPSNGNLSDSFKANKLASVQTPGQHNIPTSLMNNSIQRYSQSTTIPSEASFHGACAWSSSTASRACNIAYSKEHEVCKFDSPSNHLSAESDRHFPFFSRQDHVASPNIILCE